MRHEILSILKLAIPIIGAHFLSLIMVVTDNVMVGWMKDDDALAGLALATGFYSLITIVVVAFVGAISPLVSKAHGTENWLQAGHVVRQGLLLSLVVSALLALGLFFAEPLILMTGQDPFAASIAADYLNVMIWTVPAQLGFLTLRNFTEGCEDSVPSVVIGGIVAAINVGLDYSLILGEWGFPKLGVEGAGWATASLTWLSFVMLGAYILLKRKYKKYELVALPRPNFGLFREILRLAIPLAGAVGMEMGFFVACTFLMGRLGVTELAAHQVALNATSLFFMIPLGLSFAVSIRIASYMGRGDITGARRAWHASLFITLVFQSCIALFLITQPELIVRIYEQTGEVETLAIQFLFVAGLFQFFDGFQVLGMGVLRGLEDVRYAFGATFVSFWVIGIGTVTYFYSQGNPHGIWYGLLVGLAAACLAHHSRIWLKTSPERRLR